MECCVSAVASLLVGRILLQYKRGQSVKQSMQDFQRELIKLVHGQDGKGMGIDHGGGENEMKQGGGSGIWGREGGFHRFTSTSQRYDWI